MNTARRVFAVTVAMVRQNRWLLFLLLLWPVGLTAVLLWPTAGPVQMEDALAILHQEAFAGMALVAASGAQLGKEERSRRVFQVLGRAVGRGECLFALGLAAWLPLLAYLAALGASASLLAHALAASGSALPWVGVVALVGGVYAASLSLLLAVLLPPAIATVAALALVAATAGAGRFGLPGPGRALGLLASFSFADGSGATWLDVGETLLVAAALAAAAALVFKRRDLRLSE